MTQYWRTLNRSVKILGLLIAVSAGVVPSYGQGESAVPFLLIAPNSRASGIGEAGTGSVDDVSAIYWNPAALSYLSGQEVSITHAAWLPQFQQADLFYDYLNYRNYIDDIGGAIGASITYLNLGEFIRTNSNGQEEGRFKAFEFAVTAGYATKVLDNLGLGFNIRYIHSNLSPIGTAGEQGDGIASTIGADVAVLFRPDTMRGLADDLGKAFSVGLNLQNIGPKLTYIDAAQADPIPTNIRLGFGVKLFQDEFNEMTMSLDFARLLIKRYPAEEDSAGNPIGDPPPPDPVYEAIFTAWSDGGLKKVVISGGLEYWYDKLIALRFGYFYEHPDYGNRNFYTFGAGIRYDIYGFDFSYISAPESNHPLSDTIRFSLLIAWGGIGM